MNRSLLLYLLGLVAIILTGCAPGVMGSIPTAINELQITPTLTLQIPKIEPSSTALPVKTKTPEPTIVPTSLPPQPITIENAGQITEVNRWSNLNGIGMFHVLLSRDNSIAYLPVDSDVYAVDPSTSDIYNTISPKFKDYIRNIGLSPEGNLLVISYQSGEVKMVDTDSYSTVFEIVDKSETYEPNTVEGISFSPTEPVMALGRKNGKITITSIKDGSTLETIDNYSKSIPELSYSPYGQFLAASDEDGTIRIWDVNTLKLIKSYKGSNGVFSPDGSFFAYMTEDNLFIINVEKFAQRVIINQKDHAGLGAFPGPWDGRGCLIINPDGSLIATGHRNGKVALWNTLDGNCTYPELVDTEKSW